MPPTAWRGWRPSARDGPRAERSARPHLRWRWRMRGSVLAGSCEAASLCASLGQKRRSRLNPSSRRSGLVAWHQRSHADASGPKAAPGPGPGRSVPPVVVRAAWSRWRPTSGRTHTWRRRHRALRCRASRAASSSAARGFAPVARSAATVASPCSRAAVAARCTGSKTQELLYSISLARSSVSDAGTTIQPTRHPVMDQAWRNC